MTGSPASDASPGSIPERVEIFDTTLRDGAPVGTISVSLEERLVVPEHPDRRGVAWP